MIVLPCSLHGSLQPFLLSFDMIVFSSDIFSRISLVGIPTPLLLWIFHDIHFSISSIDFLLSGPWAWFSFSFLWCAFNSSRASNFRLSFIEIHFILHYCVYVMLNPFVDETTCSFWLRWSLPPSLLQCSRYGLQYFPISWAWLNMGLWPTLLRYSLLLLLGSPSSIDLSLELV